MKRIVRLTENDLTRIVKRVLKEEQLTTDNEGNGKRSFYIDNKIIYAPVYGYGGGVGYQTTTGRHVWLNNKGIGSWPAGDVNVAKKNVNQLVNAIDGLDITGTGAKNIKIVADNWKRFDLLTQNEFIKEWYKSKGKNWGTPWRAISDDNEDYGGKMIQDSIQKVRSYCKSYVDQKNMSDELNQPAPNVICDIFIDSMYVPK